MRSGSTTGHIFVTTIRLLPILSHLQLEDTRIGNLTSLFDRCVKLMEEWGRVLFKLQARNEEWLAPEDPTSYHVDDGAEGEALEEERASNHLISSLFPGRTGSARTPRSPRPHCKYRCLGRGSARRGVMGSKQVLLEKLI